MTSDENSSLLQLLDDLVPWFRPCQILTSSVDTCRLPPRKDLENSLSVWLSEEAISMIDALVDSNSKVCGLPLTTRWVNVEWVDDIPAALDSTKTILAFACPTIVKEGRLALILYYSDGPRATRPHWMIAALARSSHANDWKTVLQRGPIFGDLY